MFRKHSKRGPTLRTFFRHHIFRTIWCGLTHFKLDIKFRFLAILQHLRRILVWASTFSCGHLLWRVASPLPTSWRYNCAFVNTAACFTNGSHSSTRRCEEEAIARCGFLAQVWLWRILCLFEIINHRICTWVRICFAHCSIPWIFVSLNLHRLFLNQRRRLVLRTFRPSAESVVSGLFQDGLLSSRSDCLARRGDQIWIINRLCLLVRRFAHSKRNQLFLVERSYSTRTDGFIQLRNFCVVRLLRWVADLSSRLWGSQYIKSLICLCSICWNLFTFIDLNWQLGRLSSCWPRWRSTTELRGGATVDSPEIRR